MAKFVLICGPQAVGKMTVGQELAKLTGLKFMHNHETIDLPLKFFEFKSEQRERLTDLFRFSIFEEVAKSDLMLITGHTTITALEKYLRDIDAELPEDYSNLLG